MKIWYLYYNEETKQIDYAEHYIQSISASLKTPSNIDEFRCQCYTEEEHAINGATKCNEDLNSFTLLIHKCKDCGIYFFTTADEEIWFKAHKLSVPKRCEVCRRNRRKSA